MSETHILAFDLDGTLFNTVSEISQRSLIALDAANQAGYRTVAVTGRSWRTAFDKLKPATGIDHIICSNGAYLYQQSSSRVIWENPIVQQEVEPLVDLVKAVDPTVCFGWEAESGLFFDPQFLALTSNSATLEGGGNASALGTQRLYKLFIRSAELTHLELLDALASSLEGLATITSSGAPFLEATSYNTDKASALTRLAEELGGSAANTIAFGDNLNDLPMLAWAATSVAMGNALPLVRERATDSTLSNIEDGVARYIEKLLC